jgi:hypothetical protein
MSIRNEKRERKTLAQRLSKILRALAMTRHKYETMLMDLSCSLDVSGPLNTSKLPMEPTGFVVPHTSVLQHRNMTPFMLCELQVISMAVMYYRLYRLSGDTQDARSCSRYCGWLEDYIERPSDYSAIVRDDFGVYLCPIKRTKEACLPDWLADGEGETV